MDRFLLLACGLFAAALSGAARGTEVESTPSNTDFWDYWLSPVPGRILSDPLYLPPAGQFHGSTAYEFNDVTYDQFAASGRKTASQVRHNNFADQTLDYGLTDDIQLRAGATYGWESAQSTSVAGREGPLYHFNGFNDPRFGITYRFLRQSQGYPVAMDVAATYSPQVVDAEAATITRNGTVSDGRDNTNISLSIGRSMHNFTVVATAAGIYIGTGRILAANGRYRPEASAFAYGLGLRTQTRLSEDWSVNAAIAYTTAEDAVGVSGQNTVPDTIDSDNWHYSAAVNYRIIPNRLVGSFTYSYGDLGDRANCSLRSGCFASVRNYVSNTFGLRLEYTLN